MSENKMRRLGKAFLLVVASSFILTVVIYLSFVQYQHNGISSAEYDAGEYWKSSETFMMFKNKMRSRVEHMEKMCEKLGNNKSEFQSIEKSKLDHIVVDDRYQILYCYVPKVACTNLKRVFLMLTGKLNVTDPLQLKSADVHSSLDKYLTYLDSFPASGIKYRIMHYKKVIFVREPLERVLSAFRNKFVQKGNSYFKDRFGKMIIKTYRDNQVDEKTGLNVTFPEFVQYLLDPKTKDRGYNEHWESFFDLCHPCHLHYNFIGKYEDLDDDVDGLLHILNVHDRIHFPKRGDLYKTLKTEDIFQKYYKDLKPDMLNGLLNVYANDYKVFDYEIPGDVTKSV